MANLRLAQVDAPLLVQKRENGHQEPRGAEPALQRVALAERRLYGMERPVGGGQPFHGHHLGTVELRGNQVVGGSPVLDLGYWKSVAMAGNTFIGADTMVALRDATPTGQSWSGNTHRRDPAAHAWIRTTSSYTFSGWRSATGLAGGDQVQGGEPASPTVVVRQNPYEKGRANVVVLNWGSQSQVVVPLDGGLGAGEKYEVRNVQSLFGTPAAQGTFGGGTVTIPMTGVTPPTPVGLSASRAPKTGPRFDVFVVTKVDPKE